MRKNQSKKKKLNNLVMYNNEDIFLACHNFEQSYRHFMKKIKNLTNEEKKFLIEQFDGQFVSTIIKTTMPVRLS